MRVFAVSDIHVDFDANARWIGSLSTQDYRDDFLILAGDVSESLHLLEVCLVALANRFRTVFYVPGNHELWVTRDGKEKTSLDKFEEVCATMKNCGVSGAPFHGEKLSIVPLLGWYDYSFGEPCSELMDIWADFRTCRWPQKFGMREIASFFAAMNQPLSRPVNNTVISFSHFLPRIDVMPDFIPPQHRILYPVLGTDSLEQQIRQIRSDIHVYGHSHVNRKIKIDGITYINNAYGYPSETRISAKRLLSIYEDK
jgi:predicted phosphodiesterase